MAFGESSIYRHQPQHTARFHTRTPTQAILFAKCRDFSSQRRTLAQGRSPGRLRGLTAAFRAAFVASCGDAPGRWQRGPGRYEKPRLASRQQQTDCGYGGFSGWTLWLELSNLSWVKQRRAYKARENYNRNLCWNLMPGRNAVHPRRALNSNINNQTGLNKKGSQYTINVGWHGGMKHRILNRGLLITLAWLDDVWRNY